MTLLRRTPIKFSSKALRTLNSALSKFLKLRLVREAELQPRQIKRAPDLELVADITPPGAEDYLQPDNSRLRDLIAAYAKFDRQVTTPAVWVDGRLNTSHLLYFRGQSPFVWQIGPDFEDFRYVLSYYALKCSAAADLLASLNEDRLFGVYTVEIDGRPISRDLLDSVREIDFIRSHVGLGRPVTVILDIGAGYGRLVHRLDQVTGANVRTFATDAFAGSTFVSEYYLQFRKAGVKVIPLPEVEAFLEKHPLTLAVNIHSFSECTPAAIEWWVSRLARNRTRYLLIVPNRRDPETGACLTNVGENMETIFEQYGYAAVAREPRFIDPIVQLYGIDPSYLNLFKLARVASDKGKSHRKRGAARAEVRKPVTSSK